MLASNVPMQYRIAFITFLCAHVAVVTDSQRALSMIFACVLGVARGGERVLFSKKEQYLFVRLPSLINVQFFDGSNVLSGVYNT